MPYLADTITSGKPSGSYGEVGQLVYIAPDPPNAETYINVRLSNGDAFYTAGGTSVSGGGVLTADQGAPNLVSAAWPVKITDGSSVLGTAGVPLVVNLGAGSGSVGAPLSVTGTVGLARAVDVASLPSVQQGSPAGLGSPWPVIVVSGSDPVGTQSHPTWVTGSVFVLNPSGGVGGSVTALSGSVTGLLVGGQALSSGNPIPISDAGGSLTVDGTVSVAAATLVSGSQTGLLIGANPVAASNPLPVTGTVALSQAVAVSSLPNVTVANPQTTITTLSGSLVGHLVGGVPASNVNPFPVSDAGGSLTVDGTVVVSSATLVSGSQTGLLVGANPVAASNPLPVTGSVSLTQAIAISSLPNVTVANPQTSVTVLSGSVSGLLVGGVALANANPLPVSQQGTVTTSTTLVSGSQTGLLIGANPVAASNPLPITGTIGFTQGVAVSSLPAVAQGTPASLASPWRVQLVSGSDVVGQTTNPFWVTGSVFVINQGGAGSNVTAVSGSVVGLLQGGQAASMANPIPVTGTVGFSQGVAVTSIPAVAQGTAAALSAPWRVQLVSGSDVVGQTTNPIWVTGSVFVINQSAGGPSSNVTVVSGSVTGHLVGGLALSNANPFPISDAGGSLTVDGTVAVSNPQTTITALSGSVTGLLAGGVAVSNANPVPISDAGGSITVDGTVSVGSPNVTALSGSVVGMLVGGLALSNANPVPVSAQGTVTVAAHSITSGSVTGLLVGGVALSSANPVPVSQQGTVTVTATVVSGSQTGILMGANPVAVSNPLAVASISGSQIGILIGANPVASSNPLPVKETRSGTSAVTKVNASVTNVTLKVTNANRLGLSIYNDSTAQLFVKYGATATSDDFSLELMPDDYLEVPYGYTGQLDGLWTAATGSARVTEFT